MEPRGKRLAPRAGRHYAEARLGALAGCPLNPPKADIGLTAGNVSFVPL